MQTHTDLILGTAGHIDHGKTSLIRALTGTETDRLPEERKRGITIELGFAELEIDQFRLGIVDVPGHERFVRNMLAGATGMDVALLVVAADDSVKPQTREHLEILKLLDLPAGVIALTKCDLADPDWMELVEEEIRELVEGTFLADAPIVRTCAHSGEGLDSLRDALASASEKAVASGCLKRIEGPFRMPIDRNFTIAGHGTVVTGSIASGATNVGDQLVIEPDGIEVRVRGLQSHDRSAESIHRGQRGAINLAGVHHDQIRRGQELAIAGHLVPSRLLTVELSLGDSVLRPLKNRARVRLHVGTAELIASVVLLGRSQLGPGETAFAQLFLSEPAVTIWNQPFVLRSESPVITLGGGRILDPDAEKLRAPGEEVLSRLAALLSPDPLQRGSAALFFVGLRSWKASDLARLAGIEDGIGVCQQLIEQGDLVTVKLSTTRTLQVNAGVLDRLCQQIESTLAKLHSDNPLKSTLDRNSLASRFRWLPEQAILDVVLRRMKDQRILRITDRGIALEGYGPKLSAGERKLLEQIIAWYREAGFQPPTVKECQARATKNQASVAQLVGLAASDGDLIEVSRDYHLHADTERTLRETLTAAIGENGGLTLSQIREILHTSRKYAVPFCEYLDRIGFTRREGDLRVLA